MSGGGATDLTKIKQDMIRNIGRLDFEHDGLPLCESCQMLLCLVPGEILFNLPLVLCKISIEESVCFRVPRDISELVHFSAENSSLSDQ